MFSAPLISCLSPWSLSSNKHNEREGMKEDQGDVNCIYHGKTILDEPLCLLGHRWGCKNDSSICGVMCLDFIKEVNDES